MVIALRKKSNGKMLMTSSMMMPCIVMLLAGLACHSVRGAETAGENQPRYYRQVERGPAKSVEYDVVVYGGTPAGVTAAIQSARMGKKTVLLSFNRHVGGLTSGGLSSTDIGKRDSIGGGGHGVL